MEEKINVAEILKDKPQGTKLYSSACGKCKLEEVDDKSFKISFYNSKSGFMVGGEGYLDKNGKLYDDGECVVFPSKEMRDWSKFAWKKGDVLVNSRGLKILFDRWANGNYTSFYAKTINLVEDGFLDTNLHTLASEKEAKSFIKCIEERFGGKLNLQTLEIQKQPEFKNGDIVAVDLDRKNIRIFKEKKNGNNICWGKYYIGFSFNNEGKRIQTFKNYTADCSSDRLATDSEKQQLFSALEKEGKAWDAEKKQIVDLKTKVELRPFDRVLVRDSKSDNWRANLFGYIGKDGYCHCVYANWAYCIPYEGNELLLGTSKDVEG